MSIHRLSISIIAVLILATFVSANESDELRERAEAMQRDAAKLVERGRLEEAENLARRSMAMFEAAERLEPDRSDARENEIMKLRHRMETLRKEERELAENDASRERLEDVRREVRQIETELREISRHPHHVPHPPRDGHAARDQEEGRRLEHMRMATEHLKEAGLHEIAEQVVARAEAARRELEERREKQNIDLHHRILEQLETLRRETERLRNEVRELKFKR